MKARVVLVGALVAGGLVGAAPAEAAGCPSAPSTKGVYLTAGGVHLPSKAKPGGWLRVRKAVFVTGEGQYWEPRGKPYNVTLKKGALICVFKKPDNPPATKKVTVAGFKKYMKSNPSERFFWLRVKGGKVVTVLHLFQQ